jgi:hypothetical protein
MAKRPRYACTVLLSQMVFTTIGNYIDGYNLQTQTVPLDRKSVRHYRKPPSSCNQ